MSKSESSGGVSPPAAAPIPRVPPDSPYKLNTHPYNCPRPKQVLDLPDLLLWAIPNAELFHKVVVALAPLMQTKTVEPHLRGLEVRFFPGVEGPVVAVTALHHHIASFMTLEYVGAPVESLNTGYIVLSAESVACFAKQKPTEVDPCVLEVKSRFSDYLDLVSYLPREASEGPGSWGVDLKLLRMVCGSSQKLGRREGESRLNVYQAGEFTPAVFLGKTHSTESDSRTVWVSPAWIISPVWLDK